jgi:uncharacterized membrane protein YfcA
MDISAIFLFLVCGLLSGMMNTLASSGSAITLPIMIFFGVPPSVANATNRLPILVGSTISVYNFQKSKDIIWSKTIFISIPLFFGVIAGTVCTKFIDSTKLQWVLLVAMVFSFILIITNSRKILKGRSLLKTTISLKSYIVFFLIGIWAGLIVLDSAILILFELILACGFNLTKANPIKNFLLIIISFVSLLIFAFNGIINWEIGLILSIGSFFGGYWGSKIAHLENVKKWIYRILIGIITFEIITLVVKLFFDD